MDDFDTPVRSTAGINELTEFIEEIPIYVEGPKDKALFEALLKSMEFRNWIIIPAGGRPELEKYARTIIDSGNQIIAIADMDYDALFDHEVIKSHPRIVRIPAHSIENIMFTSSLVEQVIQDNTLDSSDYLKDFEAWRKGVFNQLCELIEMDATNESRGKDKSPLAVIDKWERYCNDKRKTEISVKKLSDCIANLKRSIIINKNIAARIKMTEDKYYIIRGHFYESAVFSYIIHKIHMRRQIRIDKENLFSIFLGLIKRDICKLDGIDYLRREIKNAFSSLKMRNSAA